ncbi:MAG: hypothetical protein ACRDP6_36895 [Actinoallomurus sp.]
MADSPSIPGTDNWSEWTFEQALMALTGEGTDMHALAGGPWYTVPSDLSSGGDLNYHAWGEFFMSVNFNKDSGRAWSDGWTNLNEIVNDLARGKRGNMDVQTLTDLAGAIQAMANWTDTTGSGFHSWANALNSDDSAFKGKAAALIQFRLKAQADGLDDTRDQITTRHGMAIADAVANAAKGLDTFNRSMADTWHGADVGNIVANTLNAETQEVFDYLSASNLVLGTPNYILDRIDFRLDRQLGRDYINRAMAAYPKGALNTQAGWDNIGNHVKQTVLDYLKANLDTAAQSAIQTLVPLYLLATNALVDITAPIPETPPHITPDPNNNPSNGNGDFSPPPNGNFTPPPDGGGSGSGPPPDGGLGDGGLGNGGLGDGGLGNGGLGDGGLGNGGLGDGGLGNGGLGDGGLGSGGPGGGGLGDPGNGALGNGAFMPGLMPPAGGAGGDGSGDGKVGPGGDGSFGEPGAGNGIVTPPGGAGGADGGVGIPSGAGSSKTTLPPGSALPPGGAGGGGSGVGAGAGAGRGFGASPGSAGAGGAGAGAGGGGLGSGDSPLTTLPMQATGGSPGMSGTAGASGAGGTSGDGGGGVPFFPPMMGGGMGGGAGDKPQERERQTWLSEDEKVWGTNVALGSGVIGRFYEDEEEADEARLVGPVRGRRRADTPRRRPAVPPETETETESTGESAGGTAAEAASGEESAGASS